MSEYTYQELKLLMKGKEYPYQRVKAQVRYIDKNHCKKGYCNVMLLLPIAMGNVLPKCFTITVDDLRKVYYGEKTFDDLDTI